ERHSGVGGVDERALTLDEEELAASALALDDQALGRAREEVGNDGVDSDSPTGDRDPRLAGGDEDGFESPAARFEVELEPHRLLPDRAVRADGERDLRGDRQVLPGRHVQAFGRSAKVA